MALFYKNIDTVRSPISSPEKPVDAIIDTKWKLAELKAAIKWETDAAKRKELERKLSRMERFDRVQEGTDIKDTKTREDIQKILKWKNTETYSNSDILTLRKKNIDIASLTLVNKQNADLDVKSSELKSGDSFTVNFGANPSLRDRTGAGDILPPSVRNIKINGIDCERKNTPRPGYYDAKWKYQKILDGYTIEIISIGTGNEDDTKANEKRWKNERVNDMIDLNGGNPLTNITDDTSLFSDVSRVNQERQKVQSIKSLNIEWIGEFNSDAIAAAKKVEELFGIPWQVAYGQAALETGYGRHAPNNNYFGIKWSWSSFNTKEFINGNWTTVNDSFRSYSSLEDSFLWYGKFLTENGRYRNAFLYKKDPLLFLQEVKKAWYATDPAYVSKIESIWEKSKITIA